MLFMLIFTAYRGCFFEVDDLECLSSLPPLPKD